MRFPSPSWRLPTDSETPNWLASSFWVMSCSRRLCLILLPRVSGGLSVLGSRSVRFSPRYSERRTRLGRGGSASPFSHLPTASTSAPIRSASFCCDMPNAFLFLTMAPARRVGSGLLSEVDSLPFVAVSMSRPRQSDRRSMLLGVGKFLPCSHRFIVVC